MRIGLMTGGGDCPGLNAAIRAVVRVADSAGDEVVGFHHGLRGLVDDESELLSVVSTARILETGGTVLRTARYHPDEHPGGIDAARRVVQRESLAGLVVLGGDGTLGAALELARAGIPVVGIAKTIDNDVAGPRVCIGFDTAVTTAAEAIDRVRTTGESHDRLMVVEVMGRTTGWLALCAGIAAGADLIIAPEHHVDLAELTHRLRASHDAGASSSVIVVAEGALISGCRAVDGSGIGAALTEGLAERTGFDVRLTVLGHVQRGGAPSAFDRVLASEAGIAAARAVQTGATRTLATVDRSMRVLLPLDVVAAGRRPVPDGLLAAANALMTV